MSGHNTSYFMPGYRGTLSVKTMLRGCATWETPSSAQCVDTDHALILNHDQTYTLTIDGVHGPTESFCPFFSAELVSEAVALRKRPLATLLDDPGGDRIPELVECVRRPDANLARALATL